MPEGKDPDLSFHNDRGNQWKDVDEALALWRVVGSGLQKLLCDPVAENFSVQELISKAEQLFTLVKASGESRQGSCDGCSRKGTQPDGSKVSPEPAEVETPVGDYSITIPEKQYFKIGEISELLDVEPYVLRYWESEFKILKPTRTRARQRLYHKKDVEKLKLIRHLIYDEKFPIPGAKKRLREMNKEETKRKKADSAIKRPSARAIELTGKSENSSSVEAQEDYGKMLLEIRQIVREIREKLGS
jgi:DNA-binding transcriptional MerR regulator